MCAGIASNIDVIIRISIPESFGAWLVSAGLNALFAVPKDLLTRGTLNLLETGCKDIVSLRLTLASPIGLVILKALLNIAFALTIRGRNEAHIRTLVTFSRVLAFLTTVKIGFAFVAAIV